MEIVKNIWQPFYLVLLYSWGGDVLCNSKLKEIQDLKDQHVKSYIKLVLKHGFSKVTTKLENQIHYYEELEDYLLHGLPGQLLDL